MPEAGLNPLWRLWSSSPSAFCFLQINASFWTEVFPSLPRVKVALDTRCRNGSLVSHQIETPETRGWLTSTHRGPRSQKGGLRGAEDAWPDDQFCRRYSSVVPLQASCVSVSLSCAGCCVFECLQFNWGIYGEACHACHHLTLWSFVESLLFL